MEKNPDDSKYFTTNEFNKFSGKIFDKGLKRAKLETTTHLSTIEQCAVKNEEKITVISITLAMMDHKIS